MLLATESLHFYTFPFVCFFLVVFAVYWLSPQQRWRMLWLLTASCIFYMSFWPWQIILIVASASVDYLVALRLEALSSKRVRRLLLILSISINLGLLAFFKYVNFFIGNTNSLLGLLGWSIHWPLFENLLLPLGISFYTFETISYVVDVYKRRTAPVRSLLDYALYIMFFPHLAAGPIVRPRDFLPQLQRLKRFDWPRIVVGLQLFLVGLFKKAVIADHLAAIVDPVFADPAAHSSRAAWLGTLAYAVQIYGDFSGYTDMAMGLAHLLGFKLPLNFNMPYFAANITDFWRRWHISLSSWLRDYLYIPLGGNRHGRWATYRNLMLTMLLGGLWHGASWTFVFWGFYHGLLLAVHRAIAEWRGSDRRERRARLALLPPAVARPLYVAGTFLLVCIGWVFFRAPSFAAAGTILRRLAWPTAGVDLDLASTLLVGACVSLVFAGHVAGSTWDMRRAWRRMPAPVLGGVLGFLLLLALMMMPESAKGFIYFQF